MPGSDAAIREATAGDADSIGRVHVRAWQSAYRGVMSDEYLDGLRAHDRSAMWRTRLLDDDPSPVLVAVVADDVVGFAAFGGERSDQPTGRGELYALNLDPAHWGKGIGRLLLRHAVAGLAAAGYSELVLWVVLENRRARSLYESEGWIADGDATTAELLGVTIDEIRYRRSAIA